MQQRETQNGQVRRDRPDERDERGFANRSDNITSADQPGLWFVGQRYDSTGALANIRADAIAVGRRLAN